LIVVISQGELTSLKRGVGLLRLQPPAERLIGLLMLQPESLIVC
jgi:hypothetical protein